MNQTMQKMPTATVLHDPRERAVAQRFEAKYFLTEVQVDMVRDFISDYTVVDENKPIYPVTSMYADSPNLALYKSSFHGEKNRFKLRIRSYVTDEEQPVFAEVKQRVGRVIRKYRSILHRDVVNNVPRLEAIGEDFLVNPDQPRQRENLMLFSDLAARYIVRPTIGVRYSREAFVSRFDEPVRITFDRDIAFAPIPERPGDLWKTSHPWSIAHEAPIVLEIKFTDTYPFWVRRLVQRLQLVRLSMAKYVLCINELQREGGFFKLYENLE